VILEVSAMAKASGAGTSSASKAAGTRVPAGARRAKARRSASASAGSLPYSQSIEACLAAAIGAHGLAPASLAAWTARLGPRLAALRQGARDGSDPLLRIPAATADIEAAEEALARLSIGGDTLVFLGTGGSSLGGQALAQVAGWNIPGDSGPEGRKGLRTRFYDNLDPRTLEQALLTLDLAQTRFVVISKSGGTPETLAQAVAVLGAIRAVGLGQDFSRLVLGLTEPARGGGAANPLRALCEHFSIPLLEHDPGIGGRFAGLTNVGLLPAISRGLDVRAVRTGAQSVVEALCAAAGPADFAPALGAAVSVGLMREKGIRTLVMLPYADRLESFGAWFVQLWAESLGKQGQGSTPVAALGPLDQHSQLQLWLDGPREHLVTVVRPALAGAGQKLEPELARLAGVPMLAGRTLGDLVEAQAHAIPEALGKAGRPVRTIELPRLDERAVGALMMHFMLETILAADLLGVDPFGQPAVELGKELTKENLKAES
jgi:glucose-6-phosphate isomerase